ncbi:MAG: archaeoflavoprotein AfpA [Candidatus Bathyarchaeota archaeon]|nr:MAG: archaeoflavoprotein AfpA [Candidatus Bathyarchaeota archaeon]
MTEESMPRVAWGITGAGDMLRETLDAMRSIGEAYAGKVEVEVYLSKAGEQVLQRYRLLEELKEAFRRVLVEKDSNTPFMTGRLQLCHYRFLLIAPATSNTVAKIAHGISDTMLTNAAIQALKAYVPVHIMPVDYREGTTVTRLPDGRALKLRVRKEDAENARRVSEMDGVHAFEEPREIEGIFRVEFGAL